MRDYQFQAHKTDAEGPVDGGNVADLELDGFGLAQRPEAQLRLARVYDAPWLVADESWTEPLRQLGKAADALAELLQLIDGGGAVYVGKRVGGISTRNCAARVGSMVGVICGVGVGGGSITGSDPRTSTRSE